MLRLLELRLQHLLKAWDDLALVAADGNLDQLPDLLQCQPEQLRPLDEPEPGDLLRSVEPISALRPRRLLQQPTTLVVSDRLDGESRLAGKLSDLQPSIVGDLHVRSECRPSTIGESQDPAHELPRTPQLLPRTRMNSRPGRMSPAPETPS